MYSRCTMPAMVEEGSFFLKVYAWESDSEESTKCTDFWFVPPKDGIVKNKIELTDQFVTVFSLTNSSSA